MDGFATSVTMQFLRRIMSSAIYRKPINHNYLVFSVFAACISSVSLSWLMGS